MKKLLLTTIFFLAITIAFAQNNYQDVVYLKNGSIIRGIIIEQVPNESMKIETANGSLFVLKFSEVEKMTRERVIEQSQDAASSQSLLQETRSIMQRSATVSQSNQQERNYQRDAKGEQYAYIEQYEIQPEQMSQWGVKAGINTASETTSKGETEARIGIHAGFFVEVPVSNKVGFQTEFVYSMQGATTKVGSRTYTDEIDYINLPLIFKFYVWEQRFSIDAGLQFGYMISVKSSEGGNSIDLYDYDVWNKFDTSVALGISYKITEKFDLGLRFNMGITEIMKNYEYKNSVVQLSAGYRF